MHASVGHTLETISGRIREGCANCGMICFVRRGETQNNDWLLCFSRLLSMIMNNILHVYGNIGNILQKKRHCSGGFSTTSCSHFPKFCKYKFTTSKVQSLIADLVFTCQFCCRPFDNGRLLEKCCLGSWVSGQWDKLAAVFDTTPLIQPWNYFLIAVAHLTTVTNCHFRADSVAFQFY